MFLWILKTFFFFYNSCCIYALQYQMIEESQQKIDVASIMQYSATLHKNVLACGFNLQLFSIKLHLFQLKYNSLNLLVVVFSRIAAVYLIKSSKFGYSCFDRVTTTSFEFLLSFGFQLLQLVKWCCFSWFAGSSVNI